MKAAEQARLAYLGANQAECVPWDELKPEMWERWCRVVDVCQPAPIRVPFSSAVIGRMALAFWNRYEQAGTSSEDAIRAALAAGGIERCAAPEYAPEDVAFGSRVPELEAKIENQRMNLRQLHEARERDALERARLESEIATERDILRAELAAVTSERDAAQAECKHLNAVIMDMGPVDPDAWKTELRLTSPLNHNHRMHLSCGDDELVLAKWMLLEHKESGFSVIDAPSAARFAKWLASYAAAHGCPVVLTAPVESRKAKVRWDISRERLAYIVENDDSDSSERPSDIAYRVLLNHAVIDAPTSTPTDAQVEALAKAMHAKTRFLGWNEMLDVGRESWRNSARAAYAHIGRVPVGCELDVTWQEMLSIWSSNTSSKDGMEAIRDLCRSRITPVYECNECAEKKTKVKARLDDLATATYAIRAALEGE